VQQGGFGKFNHAREVTALDKQIVPRQNRDTLYSTAVFDLDAHGGQPEKVLLVSRHPDYLSRQALWPANRSKGFLIVGPRLGT
jgi:hypothetical protein